MVKTQFDDRIVPAVESDLGRHDSAGTMVEKQFDGNGQGKPLNHSPSLYRSLPEVKRLPGH